MLSPSPGPWRLEDYEGRGHKIVDRDGNLIAVKHYATGAQELVDARTIVNSEALFSRLRALSGRVALALRLAKKNPDEDPELKAVSLLLEDIQGKSAPRREA